MPFPFQLLLEFFLPGMVLFCSVVLLTDLFYRTTVATALAYLASNDSMGVVVGVFAASLACYFLGTVANAVSNRLIRVWMSPYRRSIIRRKLALSRGQGIEHLLDSERTLITRFLPGLRSRNADDRLNELYAAARTFCILWSERSAKAIDYHWALVRLARATLLPLIVLSAVFLLRLVLHSSPAGNGVGLFASLVLLLLTFSTYRYREKFLIYTVFDTFFLSVRLSGSSAPVDR